MRRTPFDDHAARVNAEGYHNHRVNTHSDLISQGIVQDLYGTSRSLRRHLDDGLVGFWVNRRNPWGRKRNTDLIIGQPVEAVAKPSSPLGFKGAATLSSPDPDNVRVIGEHKSIVTAHRNRSARHDDLDHLYQDANAKSPGTLVCATIMIGTAEWYLNVADRLKSGFAKWEFEDGKRKRVHLEEKFEREVMPRLRRHDPALMDDFIFAVSDNTERDIEASFELFQREIPVRPIGDRASPGFDAFLIVPVHYDNVHPARVDREAQRRFRLDHDRDYQAFIARLARDYDALWGT